jgi:superfamily I DNA/RNA helicase
MHLAKGLEFKAVAVMACDEDALPLRSRIDGVADEAELEDAYDTERQLLYMAASRAATGCLSPALNRAQSSCATFHRKPGNELVNCGRSEPHRLAQRQAKWPADSIN